MNPTREALRAATGRAHERVDAAFGLFDLTDRDDYAGFLRAHAEVVYPLETALERAGVTRIFADWDARRRGDALRADLSHLNDVPPLAGNVEELVRFPTLTGDHRFDDATTADIDAAIAGHVYVLEGSRLGGKFLARQLPPGFPRAYLTGAQPAERWHALVRQLDEMLQAPPALRSALAAAHEAFDRFEHAAKRWARG